MATVNYNYAQIQNGFHGLTHNNNPSYPDRLYGLARYGCWSGKITGTQAIMQGRDYAGLFQVSIDGGAFSSAPNSGTSHTLFTGLSDIEHDVIVKMGNIFGTNNGWWDISGNLLTVDGAAPSVSALPNTYNYNDNTLIGTGVMIPVGDALYNFEHYGRVQSNNSRASNSKVMFNTSASVLRVITETLDSGGLYISIDGAPLQEIPETENGVYELTGLSGEHTYNLWCDVETSVLSVQSDSELYSVGARLDQFGDSITFGAGAFGSNARVETHEVAAYFGYIGNDWAVSGWTTNDLLTKLQSGNFTTYINRHSNRVNDVAVLAIGRNNTDIDTNATVQTEYTAIIDHLVNNIGYAKVLCRGILPESGNPFTAQNAMIESLVTAYGDPNVVYIDVSGWTGISTVDGVHPDATGYGQMVDYAKVSYAPYIGNLPTPTLNVSVSGGMPDGTYRTILINDSEAVVYAADVAFVSGVAAITLPGTISENDTLRGIVEAANGTDVAPIKGTVVLA